MKSATSLDTGVPRPCVVRDDLMLHPGAASLLDIITGGDATPDVVSNQVARAAVFDWRPKLDYEVELAFVVSRTACDVPVRDALGHIVGFTVRNDVSARDLQRAHGQWFKGKAPDTTCPIGPWIVTADEFDVTAEHRLWLSVDGQRRQDAFIPDMGFDCAAILSSLSSGITPEAGDIVEAGIEGIGQITNTVRAV